MVNCLSANCTFWALQTTLFQLNKMLLKFIALHIWRCHFCGGHQRQRADMFISSYRENFHPASLAQRRLETWHQFQPVLQYATEKCLLLDSWDLCAMKVACFMVSLLHCIWTFTCCCLYSRVSVLFRLIFHFPRNLVT